MSTISPYTIPTPVTPKEVLRKPNWVNRFLQFFVSAMILIAVPESIFSLAGVGEQDCLRPDKLLGYATMEGKCVTCLDEGYSRCKTNSFGMPDYERSLVKPADVYRIAVLGDSMTQGFEVERSKNYCQLMERDLNNQHLGKRFEVLNFGVSGYNLGQMYLTLKYRVWRFHPDLVILPLRVGTVSNLRPDLSQGFIAMRPYFALTADGKLVQDNSIQDNWNSSWEAVRMRNTSWLRENSHIWGVVSKCMNILKQFERKLERGWLKLKSAAIFRSSVPLQAAVQNPKAIEANLYPVCDALIEVIEKECEQHQSSLLLVRLPAHMHIHHDPETNHLLKTALRIGVPALDLTPKFDQIKDGAFYVSHFTPLGHRVAADNLIDFLRSKNLIQKQRRPIHYR